MEIIARLLIVTMFLYASCVNPFKAKPLKEFMRAKNMPFVDIAFPVSNFLMLVSSIAIIFNFYTIFAALYLIIFMGLVTYYFAAFWTLEGRDRDMLLNQFTANLTVIGGLLLLALKA
jgi:uncharacterized membrane protein YphA (DoxX/SURF4 family)